MTVSWDGDEKMMRSARPQSPSNLAFERQVVCVMLK
jgi:hypothetical protein